MSPLKTPTRNLLDTRVRYVLINRRYDQSTDKIFNLNKMKMSFRLSLSHRHRREQVRRTRVAAAAVRRVPARVVSVHAVPEAVQRLQGDVSPSGQRRQVRDHFFRDNVFVPEPPVRE